MTNSTRNESEIDCEENDNMDELSEMPPPPPPMDERKRRRTSMVWDHFTKLPDCTEDKPQAKCNYCGIIYACHAKRNGTGTMRMHIESYCKKSPFAKTKDASQQKLVFKNNDGVGQGDNTTNTSLRCAIFSVENARRLLAEMIIIDELSFRFVESEGFRRFVEGTITLLEPQFVLPCRTTIAKDILAIYATKKQDLKELFVHQGYRISLTTDTWTSCQNINYMVLTAHFIDSSWKLHKRIINFSQIDDHKGETIGREVERCLKHWGIEKVLTLTVDNASSNDSAIAYLVERFKHGLVLDGEFLHVRCCAHILNLIVNDGLKDAHESVTRIRNSVRFVRSSPARFAKFKKCIEDENISSKSLLCLDVPTRWNSTYLMLEAAEKFEKAFDRLDYYDLAYLKMKEEKQNPNSKDWEIARIFTTFLSVFYEVTIRISGSLYITSNMVFDEIAIIQNCIRKYSSGTGSPIITDVVTKMQLKYDKYWGNSEKANYLLYVAFILDPRHKMKFFMYCLNQLFEDKVAKEIGKKVEDVLRQLFNEYNLLESKNTSTSCSSSSSSTSKSQMSQSTSTDSTIITSNPFHFQHADMEDDEDEFDVDTEVDVYLLERRAKMDDNFDILEWWKVNSSRFRVLSKIARDVLAIPVSTVASESAFSTGGRVIDPFRSTLAPSTVEALICAQNWLRSNAINFDLQSHLEEVSLVEEDFKSCIVEAAKRQRLKENTS